MVLSEFEMGANEFYVTREVHMYNLHILLYLYIYIADLSDPFFFRLLRTSHTCSIGRIRSHFDHVHFHSRSVFVTHYRHAMHVHMHTGCLGKVAF